jgi:flavin-dependent dehydrogenase
VSISRRSFAERVVLIGDSAGQVKPISGGGIFTGTKCALICADVLSGMLEKDTLGPRSLNEYEKRWKALLGRELRISRRIRRTFVNVSDAQMDELVQILDRPKLLALVSDRGDLDFPSELAKLLFRQAPGLLKFAGPFIKSLF